MMTVEPIRHRLEQEFSVCEIFLTVLGFLDECQAHFDYDVDFHKTFVQL